MNFYSNTETLCEKGQNQVILPFQSGVINLGNTCYANSVFQCLFGDEDLCKMVLNPDNMVFYQRSENEMVHQFYLFMKACSSNNDALIKKEVSKLLEIVLNKSGLFERGQQSDANEFLLYLLNCLSDTFQRNLAEDSAKSIDNKTCLDEYQIELKQSTVCENGHTSVRFDRTMLSISIEGKRTLSECLIGYFSGTIIERCICATNGRFHNPNNKACNSFKCTNCRMHVGANQTWEVTSLPRKLVLHLKRFRFNGREVVDVLFLFVR